MLEPNDGRFFQHDDGNMAGFSWLAMAMIVSYMQNILCMFGCPLVAWPAATFLPIVTCLSACILHSKSASLFSSSASWCMCLQSADFFLKFKHVDVLVCMCLPRTDFFLNFSI